MEGIIKSFIKVLTSLKSTCACYFEKVDTELLGPPLKLQVNIKIQLNVASLSVSYDYQRTFPQLIQKVLTTLS